MTSEHEIEIQYRQIFKRLNTRKKFTIASIEGAVVTIEQDEEICGQKEPRKFVVNSAKELEEFVTNENKAEREIENTLKGNDMPYR